MMNSFFLSTRHFTNFTNNFVCCKSLTTQNFSTFSQKIALRLIPVSCKDNSITRLCSDQSSSKSSDEPEPVRKYKKPVDWLPFAWHRRPRFNQFEKSGDLVKTLAVDPSWPKPDFELSEELKDADETVKKFFTLATSTKKERKEVYRRYLLKKVQRHPLDFHSLEAKIAISTVNVRSLFEIVHANKKNTIARDRLHTSIMRRNSIIKDLRKYNCERYEFVLKELQLEYKPNPYLENTERYCKKWDLRQLTKEYCAKVVEEKRMAYHKELISQQKAFLEEKAEALEWIAEEEKALGVHKKET